MCKLGASCILLKTTVLSSLVIALLANARWERAEEFGLAPPSVVRDIILAHGGEDSAINHPIWEGRV